MLVNNSFSVTEEGKRIFIKNKQLAKTSANDVFSCVCVWLTGIFILNAAHKYTYSDSVSNHFIVSVIHWFFVGCMVDG